MSWLRNHVQSFVIPGIRTLVRAGDRELSAAHIRSFDGVVRPSTNCKHEEAGLVYATIASMVPKAQKDRESLLAMCRTLDGTVLTGTRTGELGARFAVPPGDVVHSIIWNSFRKLRKLIRREGAVLLLPGRDVWAWEVIARQRRLSSVYDSRVSRTVAGAHPALRKVIDGWKVPDLDKSLVFDTGFAGSIHREICAATQKKPLSLMLSANDNKEQIFPGHTGSRGKALAIEYFPKYFQRATVRDNDAYQALSGLEEFIKTALLTIWLWHHVSPAHIESAKKPQPTKNQYHPQHQMTFDNTQSIVMPTATWNQPIYINNTTAVTGYGHSLLPSFVNSTNSGNLSLTAITSYVVDSGGNEIFG